MSSAQDHRRGAVIVWVILAIPVIVVAIVLLLDVARIWLARIELKNALDAAALSAVKTWGEGGSTAQARLDANDAFSANTILGNSYTLTTAEGTCTNGNDSDSDGDEQEEQILLGSATDSGTLFTFNCNGIPNCTIGPFNFAARTRRTVPIGSISSTLFGLSWGPYNVTAESYARFNCPSGPPQLFANTNFTCTCP